MLVDPDAARVAELRPLIEEAPVLIENLNAPVASIGDEEPALRIEGEAMRPDHLARAAPEVTAIAQVTRRHIEDYKPWLAARPGQNKPRLTPGTIISRLGTLRMFFIRIDEWGWDEAPPKVPMFTGDLPRTDHPLPKALDDASAARLLRAAQNDKRLLVRVTVEMLLRTDRCRDGRGGRCR